MHKQATSSAAIVGQWCDDFSFDENIFCGHAIVPFEFNEPFQTLRWNQSEWCTCPCLCPFANELWCITFFLASTASFSLALAAAMQEHTLAAWPTWGPDVRTSRLRHSPPDAKSPNANCKVSTRGHAWVIQSKNRKTVSILSSLLCHCQDSSWCSTISRVLTKC